MVKARGRAHIGFNVIPQRGTAGSARCLHTPRSIEARLESVPVLRSQRCGYQGAAIATPARADRRNRTFRAAASPVNAVCRAAAAAPPCWARRNPVEVSAEGAVLGEALFSPPSTAKRPFRRRRARPAGLPRTPGASDERTASVGGRGRVSLSWPGTSSLLKLHQSCRAAANGSLSLRGHPVQHSSTSFCPFDAWDFEQNQKKWPTAP